MQLEKLTLAVYTGRAAKKISKIWKFQQMNSKNMLNADCVN